MRALLGLVLSLLLLLPPLPFTILSPVFGQPVSYTDENGDQVTVESDVLQHENYGGADVVSNTVTYSVRDKTGRLKRTCVKKVTTKTWIIGTERFTERYETIDCTEANGEKTSQWVLEQTSPSRGTTIIKGDQHPKTRDIYPPDGSWTHERWNPTTGQWEKVFQFPPLGGEARSAIYLPESASAGGVVIGTVEGGTLARTGGVVTARTPDGQEETIQIPPGGHFRLPPSVLVPGLVALIFRDPGGKPVGERRLQCTPPADRTVPPAITDAPAIVPNGGIARIVGRNLSRPDPSSPFEPLVILSTSEKLYSPQVLAGSDREIVIRAPADLRPGPASIAVYTGSGRLTPPQATNAVRVSITAPPTVRIGTPFTSQLRIEGLSADNLQRPLVATLTVSGGATFASGATEMLVPVANGVAEVALLARSAGPYEVRVTAINFGSPGLQRPGAPSANVSDAERAAASAERDRSVATKASFRADNAAKRAREIADKIANDPKAKADDKAAASQLAANAKEQAAKADAAYNDAGAAADEAAKEAKAAKSAADAGNAGEAAVHATAATQAAERAHTAADQALEAESAAEAVLRALNTISTGTQTETPRRALEPPKPATITAADVKHMGAYYQADQHRLLVFDQKSLANGIEKGVYELVWKPGALQAILSIPEIRVDATSGKETIVSVWVPARVVYGVPPGGIVGTEPKPGDTQFVEYMKKIERPEVIGDCFSSGGPKDSKAHRGVLRQYTKLEGDGDQSGTQTYTAVTRWYYYAITDCSRGYLGSEDIVYDFVLSTRAWPNP